MLVRVCGTLIVVNVVRLVIVYISQQVLKVVVIASIIKILISIIYKKR